MLRRTICWLLVPGVFAGLWTYAQVRDQEPVTIVTTWGELGGTRTGSPFTAPVHYPPGYHDTIAASLAIENEAGTTAQASVSVETLP